MSVLFINYNDATVIIMTHMSCNSGTHKRENFQECINPEIDAIVSQYCGVSLSEIMAGDENLLETGSLWNELNSGATCFEKALVEMLHLAYMRGGEY